MQIDIPLDFGDKVLLDAATDHWQRPEHYVEGIVTGFSVNYGEQVKVCVEWWDVGTLKEGWFHISRVRKA